MNVTKSKLCFFVYHIPVLVFLENFPALLRKHLRLTEPDFGWEVNRERTVAKINTSHSNLPNNTSFS